MINHVRMRNIAAGVVLAIALSACPVVAQDEIPPSGERGNSATGPQVNETIVARIIEQYLYMGYRWVEGDNFRGAAEYVEDRSSPALGIKLGTYPLPHRYFLHGEYLGPHDYYGDIGYAYSDIVLFRDVLVGLHHNLDHYSYLSPGNPPGVTYEDRNPGDENFVDFMKNDLFLRLKAPDFPLHTFVKHRYVEREGSLQERFMLGYFGGMNKVAESRGIDWTSNDLTLGANSHLGPVEFEFAHNRFQFDPGGGSVLYDYFAAGRPPDIYPHNVVPEIESSGNSLKFHTSYTGQIVSSVTLSNEEGTNNYSGAEAETLRGAFDLQWMPDPVLNMFFRYRHQKTDRDNPERVIINALASRTSYAVRRPLSTQKDLFSLAARYRPAGRLTLNGNYEYELRERTDTDEWVMLPDNSDVHRLNLSARARIMDTLKLKAVYEYHHYENPSYNIEPDNSNKVRLNASFAPTSWLMSMLEYSITLTQRDDLLYHNGSSLVEEGDRDGQTDRLLGSVSFILNPATSLTASYAYNRWKIEQDVAYSMWNEAGTSTTVLPYYDRAAPYTDVANTFALSLSTKLRKDLNMRTGLSYTVAESEYLPNPSFLTAFSTRDTTETIVTVEFDKKLMEVWEVGLKFKAGFYDEEFSDEVFAQQDDELYLTMLTLKRYF